jgi:D-apionolactonase
MNADVSALDLFGTDEPIADRRLLTAGRLSAILEDGNLRTICFAGSEAVRAINYLARDSSWGTYKAVPSNLEITESGSSFTVTYDALCSGPNGRYAYRMTINGEASGRLTMEAVGEALTDFPTNRTGFVVLHPAEAAGGRLTIRHSDGSIEETVFPEAISPDQPAFDISALTHEPAPGVSCTVEMEGDAFEMEDQRNWADASFKTYVRPLSKPRPYLIAKGEKDRQRVSVTIKAPSAARPARTPGDARLVLGAPAGPVPSMALFLDPDELPSALTHAASLGMAQDVIVRFDADRGHDWRVLVQAADFANSIGARLAIEAIFDAVDPRTEATRVIDAIRSADVEPSAVLVSPRREFKTRPSNMLAPGESAMHELVSALRANGLTASIGAGTPSFFTEFNRNPPTGDGDFIFFSVASNVHAADDLSVMETLSVYPSVIASARKLCPGKPLWLGPCTIGMRHNPYGAAVANPARVRLPAAGDDPRRGALFGAAFAVGVATQAAAAGVDHLVLAAPTGRFGLVGEADGRTPLQAVHAELAAACGSECYRVTSDHDGVLALAYRLGDLIRILVANLTPNDVALSVAHDVQSVETIDQTGAMSRSRFEPRLGPYRTIVLSVAMPRD